MTQNRIFAAVVCAALGIVVCVKPADAQPFSPTVAFAAGTASVNEGGGTVVLHLVRTGDLSGASIVGLQSNYYGGTASPSSDYGPVPSSVTFLASEATHDVAIPINDDSIYEGDESFTLSIYASSNALIGAPNSATVTIVDNDPASLVGFGQPDYTVSEHDGTANVTVVRSGVTNVTTTVSYSIPAGSTATPNSDFIPVNGLLTFAPGQTSKVVSIPIIDDSFPEPMEAFAVALSNVTNGGIVGASATVTILDDDVAGTLAFSSPAYSVGEGDGFATVTVLRATNTTIPATVRYATDYCYSYNNCATAGQDYVATSGTLTFAPGETSKSFTVPIFDDLLPEPNEQFSVSLFNPTNATLPTQYQYFATVTIIDNDSATKIAFSPATYEIIESGGTINLNVARSGVTTGTTTVAFTTHNGTATGGADYAITAGSLTFAPGELSKTIPVQILDDTIAEGDETFTMNLSAGGALVTVPTATIRIIDDEQQSFVGFTQAGYSVRENAGILTLPVQRTGPVTGTSTVAYNLGTYCCPSPSATNGSDFTFSPGTLTFAPGESLKNISIPIVDDTIAESNEIFYVELSLPSNAAIATGVTAVTIIDDDIPTTYRLTGPFEVGEGAGSITLTLLREGNVSTPSSVSYRAQANCCSAQPGNATAGADFLPVNETLDFAPGDTSKTVTIPILQDTLTEGDESFSLIFSGAFSLEQSVTIHDDEPVPTVTVGDISVPEGNSGLTPVTLTLYLSTALQTSIPVRYSTVNGSATAPRDYVAANGVITFNPGETTKNIQIQIVGNTMDEPDKYFSLFLQSDYYYYYCCGVRPRVQPSAMVTIRNDDAAFSVDDVIVNEGDGNSERARFTVKLSVPLPVTSSVAYSTLGGSAQDGSDFLGLSGTLTFAPGETSKQVAVPIVGDRIPESNETFFLRLAGSVGAPITRAQGKATIVDDDPFYVEYDGLEYAGSGKHALLLDLFVPTTDSAAPRPLVIWVHGDHWSDGSRAASPAIREANRGYVVASIDYRSSDTASFPAQIDDVKAAVRWLRANAARYNIDPDRIAVWGFGSGGHLAALLGTSGGVTSLEDLSEGNAAFSSRVQLVIDWAGPIDLLQMQNDALPCSTMNHDSSGSWESLLIGCSVQLCHDRAAAANPASYVSPDDPPFLLMHGRADCEVAPSQSASFARVLSAAHLEVALKLYDDVGHDSRFWDSNQAIGEVDAFLDTHLKTPPRLRAAPH